METGNLGRLGWVKEAGSVFTYQIGDTLDTNGILNIDQFPGLRTPPVLNFMGYKVYLMGNDNNLPAEVQQMIGGNRLLPELIEKQVRMLYGQGPMIYRLEYEDKKPLRNWQEQKLIEEWLDSWPSRGLRDDYKEYCNKVIREFYHMESYWVKWRTTKARQIKGPLPIAGLEFISNKRARLATTKAVDIFADDLEERDFDMALVGNWLSANESTFKQYPVLLQSDPLKFPVAISYHKNPSFGEEVYGYNSFYKGIKEWIVGANLTPRYINSFLHHSLSAKTHVIIPWAWVESKEQMLENYCDTNKTLESENKTLLTVNGIELGTDYNKDLLTKYIQSELQKLSQFLSGSINQGKFFSSYSFQGEKEEQRWRFEEIPLKYKEYIEALKTYDERADQVILSAKGVDSSISNVSKDGIISKSGADVFYNYLIYLHNLPWAEEVCTKAINQAIRINFPVLYQQGYRLGFYNPAPPRQAEISPKDRLDKTPQ